MDQRYVGVKRQGRGDNLIAIFNIVSANKPALQGIESEPSE
jgi:hypothetical protein